MRRDPDSPRWTRHFVYRSEHLRTTWRFRFGLLALIGTLAWLTSGWWTAAVARSLVCANDPAPSDAILIENFDPEYLLFERARQLRQAGLASRVLVPVAATDGEPNAVARSLSDTMASLSRVGAIEIVPVREVEPISLNAARDIQRFATHQGIKSVIVVSPLFRSRRSMLVYSATLGRSGIRVHCATVSDRRDVNAWTQTLHGIQGVVEQSVKLLYYRLYVLQVAR
jgi:hypothetical protein